MSQLVIEIHGPEDEALLLALLPRLNARVISSEMVETKRKKLSQLLDELADQGGAGESFGDPPEWQREIRSEYRVLDGRDE